MLIFDLQTESALLDSQLVVDVAYSPHRRRRILCAALLMTCADDTLERYLTTGDAHVDVRCVDEWVRRQAVAHVFMNARIRANVVLGAVPGEAARARLRKRAGEPAFRWRQGPISRAISGVGRHAGPLTARDRISSF